MTFQVDDTTLRVLEWPKLRDGWAKRCVTESGASWVIRQEFLDNTTAITTRQETIAQLRLLLDEELSLPLEGAMDVSKFAHRAARGALLSGEELHACARTMIATGNVRAFGKTHQDVAPQIALLCGRLENLNPLGKRIDTAIDANGTILDEASSDLASYRKRARSLHQKIKDRLEKYLHDPDLRQYLQDDFYSVRNERYVLPVNVSFQNQIPGIVHNASQTGQTLFTEPSELVSLGNEIAIAESLVVEEERRILAEFSDGVGARADAISDAVEILATLDGYQAAAKLSQDLDGHPVRASEDAPLELMHAQHPLLLLQGKTVVANSISLTPQQQGLIVSGPNAGGKTVTLTTLGLCTLMHRMGLHVPVASGSTLPLFYGMAAVIGDAQDLEADLSTFSSHMGLLNKALRQTEPGWLVLVDEIASGTDPREGAAIARAVLKGLLERGCMVAVSTHLDEVKALGATDKRFLNARVALDPQTQQPTFALELDAIGMSNALDIARRVGIPEDILELAASEVSGGEHMAQLLRELERERSSLAKVKQELEDQKQSLTQKLAHVEQQQQEVSKTRNQLEKELRQELGDELDRAHGQVRKLIADLQRAPSIKKAQEAQQDIQQQRHEVAAAVTRLENEQQVPPKAGEKKLVPGCKVRVASYGREGEVHELDNKHVVVKMGAMKTRVARKDVAWVGPPRATASAQVHVDQVNVAPPPGGDELRCDVRGMRADEATREVEQFLDQAFAQGRSQVWITHGVGTGALRGVVREVIGHSPYVRNFRGGEHHEGGSGTTVAQLVPQRS